MPIERASAHNKSRSRRSLHVLDFRMACTADLRLKTSCSGPFGEVRVDLLLEGHANLRGMECFRGHVEVLCREKCSWS